MDRRKADILWQRKTDMGFWSMLRRCAEAPSRESASQRYACIWSRRKEEGG